MSKWNSIYSLTLLLMVIACQADESEITRDILIQEKLQERIAQFYKSKKEHCIKDALEAAGAIVDSILIARARENQDTINPLSKPQKPERPDVFILQDTGKVRSLFPIE